MMTNEDKLSITLTLGEWNVVLGILQKQPYEIVALLIQQMGAQAQKQQQQVSSGLSGWPPNANGVDEARSIGRD